LWFGTFVAVVVSSDGSSLVPRLHTTGSSVAARYRDYDGSADR